MHLSRYLSYWARARGDEPVIVFDGRALSWAAFDAQAEALAAHLSAMGVVAGDRVGCLLTNRPEWCVAFAASIKLGAIFVPINNLFGPFELKQIVADSACAAIISTDELMCRLQEGEKGTRGDGAVKVYGTRGRAVAMLFDEVVGQGGKVAELPLGTDDDILIICYTSGTTGSPKGVMLTHRAVETMVTSMDLTFGWSGAERFLILAPLAFTGGVVTNLAPVLITGACAWLMQSVDPVHTLGILRDNRITMMGGVPALWQRVSEAPGFAEADLSCLRGVTGGSPVPRALLDAFSAKGVVIRQQYGLTEACGGICGPDAAAALAHPEACGAPFPSMDIVITDEGGKPVEDGKIGEICIRGEQLMKGYWRNPEATAASVKDGWFSSGDLGRWNEHGELVIVDRKKNMVISGGINIYPAEVERAMATIAGVVDVVAFGVASAQWGEEMVALVHGAELTNEEQIYIEARRLLGAVKAPKAIRLSQTPLPRTASNKIARDGLQVLWDTLGTGAS